MTSPTPPIAADLIERINLALESAATAIDTLTAQLAEAREGVAREREACAQVADEHLAMVQPHHPDEPMEDLVSQGYGNAALNIGVAIRARLPW